MIGIVASRLVERYHRPVVLIAGTEGDWKGSGRSIPAFDLHAGLAACSAHLERFGGHRAAAGLSIRPENVGRRSPRRSPPTPTSTSPTTTSGRSPRSTRSSPAPRSRSASARSCGGSRRSGSATPASTCSSPAASSPTCRRSARGSTFASASRDRGRPAGTAIAFGLGAQLDRFRRVGRYDVAFRLQENTLERNDLAAARRPADLRHARPLPRAARALRRRVARRHELSPERQAVVDELGLEQGGPWRSLLESETFRALLDEPCALAAAPLRRAAEQHERAGRASTSAASAVAVVCARASMFCATNRFFLRHDAAG